jgi:hypothetical protein
VGGLALAAVLAFLFGLIVMALWNWLMPEIFGLRAITYWEAWGLVLLAHILFKLGGHRDHGSPRRDRSRDEEWKERFRERFKDRFFGSEGPCGGGRKDRDDESGGAAPEEGRGTTGDTPEDFSADSPGETSKG